MKLASFAQSYALDALLERVIGLKDEVVHFSTELLIEFVEAARSELVLGGLDLLIKMS